jgi:hypothetical protein
MIAMSDITTRFHERTAAAAPDIGVVPHQYSAAMAGRR